MRPKTKDCGEQRRRSTAREAASPPMLHRDDAVGRVKSHTPVEDKDSGIDCLPSGRSPAGWGKAELPAGVKE